MTTTRTRGWLGVAAVGGALVLAACGGGIEDIKDEPQPAGGEDCGDLNIAVNPWTGYVANAHVIGYVAKTELGCNVTYPESRRRSAGRAWPTAPSTPSSRTGATTTS